MSIRINKYHWIWFLLAILLTALMLSACGAGGGQLKPLRPTTTPGGEISGQPLLVTFSDLQADPHAYRDKLIRVTGGVLDLAAPGCRPYSGPAASWALFAEELRLDAVGLDDLPRFAAQELLFTIDGIFRQYEGPLGCGKGPPFGIAWYLEAFRVVQPNPLAYAGGDPGNGGSPVLPPAFTTATPPGSTPGGPTAQPTLGGTEVALTGTPPATITSSPFTPTAVGTVTPGGTAIPTASPTPSATLVATMTPLATATLPAGTATATAVQQTVTPPSPTPTSDGYPILPTPTNTPDGYPPGQATPTPDPYS